METKTKKEPVVTVKVKKIVIDCGSLNIATKKGSYFFFANEVKELPKAEADELIRVRRQQREGSTLTPGCDLIIVED